VAASIIAALLFSGVAHTSRPRAVRPGPTRGTYGHRRPPWLVAGEIALAGIPLVGAD
jgi:hypothetical protein